MLTNADCTIYFNREGKYIRQVVYNIFWSDSKQSNVLKTGMKDADSVKVMIPRESADNLIFTSGKDFIMKSIVEFEFNNTDSKSISESMKELSKLGSVHTVTVADNKYYGSLFMHHWDLSCR